MGLAVLFITALSVPAAAEHEGVRLCAAAPVPAGAAEAESPADLRARGSCALSCMSAPDEVRRGGRCAIWFGGRPRLHLRPSLPLAPGAIHALWIAMSAQRAGDTLIPSGQGAERRSSTDGLAILAPGAPRLARQVTGRVALRAHAPPRHSHVSRIERPPRSFPG